MTKIQPKMVKLHPGEVVYCYTRGSLEKPNPKWDGRSPKTNWSIFWQGFQGQSKYIPIDDRLELNLCLTDKRFFIEPVNWSPLIAALIRVVIEYAPHPALKHQTKKDFNEQLDIVRRTLKSGKPIFEISVADILQYSKDDACFIMTYKREDQEANVYFSVIEDHENWDMHLNALLSK